MKFIILVTEWLTSKIGQPQAEVNFTDTISDIIGWHKVLWRTNDAKSPNVRRETIWKILLKILLSTRALIAKLCLIGLRPKKLQMKPAKRKLVGAEKN